MGVIKVAVTGASGKMSKEVIAALCREDGLDPVGAVSTKATEDYLSLPDGSGLIPLSSDLEAILARTKPDVLVDFTNAEYSFSAAILAVKYGTRPVIGTSGISQERVAELSKLCREKSLGAVIAPNFALGAVVMMHLAKVAAPFFDYAEVIEMHHEAKADAPSGTAIATARDMAAAREKPFSYSQTLKETLPGSRGSTVDGIAIHSLRLPGMVAHQEIVMGSLGQTLRIRHDTISRECYMPGVVLAVKEVLNREELVYGLDKLIGL